MLVPDIPRDSICARFQISRPGFNFNVDLTLPGRGISVVSGHSGSGKTTLLRCLAGLERCHNGLLSLNGNIWQDAQSWLPPHRRPVGFVFQEASLFPHLSALNNIRYGMPKNLPYRFNLGFDLDEIIALLGIGPLLDRRPHQLSGGEAQRVALARALASDPALLLMDEPFAALDLARKREVLPYIKRIRDTTTLPIVYVTHVPGEIRRLADYRVILDNGRVIAEGENVDDSLLDLL